MDKCIETTISAARLPFACLACTLRGDLSFSPVDASLHSRGMLCARYLVFQLKTHASLFQDQCRRFVPLIRFQLPVGSWQDEGGEDEEDVAERSIHPLRVHFGLNQEEEPDLSPVTAAILLLAFLSAAAFALS